MLTWQALDREKGSKDPRSRTKHATMTSEEKLIKSFTACKGGVGVEVGCRGNSKGGQTKVGVRELSLTLSPELTLWLTFDYGS